MVRDIQPQCEIEVDGGIDPLTAPQVVRAGARVLVAGTAIFRAEGGVRAGMDRIRESLGSS
jgi:ribulose-phosphate 3-epimerase